MSLFDEFQHANKMWSRDKIEGMIRRTDKGYIELTGEAMYTEGDGWYGERCRAYDSGDPEKILDCIQLEQAVNVIKDQAVKAAVILSMHGWDEQDIGAVLRDRKHRSGSRLVEVGIGSIARYERERRVAGQE